MAVLDLVRIPGFRRTVVDAEMTADSSWAIGVLGAAILALNLWHAWWLDRKHHREQR